jgi:hypothetical protein
MEAILESTRGGKSHFFLYVPNFCIAEIFNVFMKHAFGRGTGRAKNGRNKLSTGL